MSTELISRYLDVFGCAAGQPQERGIVKEVLEKYGIDNAVYFEWLVASGGGPIGPDWYDSPQELAKSQEKLNNEWPDETGFVIGWDGVGNPILIQPSGQIYSPDHDFGQSMTMGESFEDLLKKALPN